MATRRRIGGRGNFADDARQPASDGRVGNRALVFGLPKLRVVAGWSLEEWQPGDGGWPSKMSPVFLSHCFP